MILVRVVPPAALVSPFSLGRPLHSLAEKEERKSNQSNHRSGDDYDAECTCDSDAGGLLSRDLSTGQRQTISQVLQVRCSGCLPLHGVEI